MGAKAYAAIAEELAKRAKSGIDSLAMDFTSRMDRVKDQGFQESTRYRGLSEPYDEAKTSHLTWTTDNPEYASAYSYGGPDKQNINQGSNVMPVKIKSDKPFDFGYRSQFTEVKYDDMLDRLRRGANDALGRGDITRDKGLDILDKIEDMRDAATDVNDMKPVYSWWNNKPEMVDVLKDLGHDSLIAKEGIDDNISTVAIFGGDQIRSVNAAFDPAKKESSNLLASTIPAAVGLGALTQGEEAEAGGVSKGVTALHDLLQPMGKSRMVGDEKLVMDTPELKVFEADPHYTSQGQGKSYRYVKYEDGNPVSTLQFGTKGPRSKKATIQNIHTDENSRRSGHAKDLLDRARQDFDIKHSDDLTNDGRAWSKAVPAIGTVGAGAAAATYTPEQNKAYAQSIISNEPPRTQGEQQWRSEMQGANMKLEDYMGLATGAVVGALETLGGLSKYLVGNSPSGYPVDVYSGEDKLRPQVTKQLMSGAQSLRGLARNKGASDTSVETGTYLSPL
jgi:hypothetical protein